MEKKEVVLISNIEGRNAINFQGAFPQNKWTKNLGGKVYLTEREFEWLKINHPHVIGKLWIEEGSQEEVKPAKKDLEDKYAEFFKQHVNKAKSRASKMEDLEEVEALLKYADDNEINNRAVDALIDRANELGK